MLVPLEEYVKAGIYLGTKVVTPAMKKYVYRRRADGLAIFNTNIIDEKLKEAVAYLSQFDKENVILVCKRPAGWKTAKMFSQLTGIRTFAKKYPAGILTNTNLPDFFENELTIITDSWLDKNGLNDTLKVRKKVLMIVMCHYPLFTWNHAGKVIGNKNGTEYPSSICLCGHSHTEKSNIDTGTTRLDVGLDGHNYYPWSLSEVWDFLKNKQYRQIDHHGKDTNHAT